VTASEPLGNARIARAECVGVRIGRPLREAELNLPAESVEVADRGEREGFARQVGHEHDVLLACAVLDRRSRNGWSFFFQRTCQVARFALEATPEGGQLAPTPRGSLRTPDRCAHDRVDPGLEAHEEEAPGVVHTPTVVDIRVAPVGQEQRAAQVPGGRQKLSLSVSIRF